MNVCLLLDKNNVVKAWGKGKDTIGLTDNDIDKRVLNIQIDDAFDTSIIYQSTFQEDNNCFIDTSRQQFLLEQERQNKLFELSTKTEQTICFGIDVETTQGIEHFSLSSYDQVNITNLFILARSVDGQYPYHADGKSSRLFSSQEIISIGDKALNYKTYHLARFQELKKWVNRTNDIDTMKQINYDSALPDDLQENLTSLLVL